MINAGIRDDFSYLVGKVGLTDMNDESEQYASFTKTFVESFHFSSTKYNPSVTFKIYDNSVTFPLQQFCSIIGIPTTGTMRNIKYHPTDLMELYREVTNDDDRKAQRGKIRNIQLPAIRYFTYYLATSILGRENTSNISHYHLAFLATALDDSTKYNLGALIARRLSAKGPIYGRIVVAHVVAALDLTIDPNDVLLEPQRLDLAAMKHHQFVTANSCAGSLVYRMLFVDGTEREIPLPQSSLFIVHRKPWSRSKEELDDQLRLLGFHGQRQYEEEEAATEDYTTHYTEPSSSSYQNEGASSSYYRGNISFDAWSPWV
jgi:hypothetical protein